MMKFRLIAALITVFALVGVGRVTSAQDEAKKTTHQKVRTLTGCLDKTENDPNEYQLTTKAGGTWEIKSDSVKMAPHVGQTVTITGVVTNATAHGLKEDTKTEAREHGHMTVTSLKMVSRTCSE